jgi:hypothetical protein
MSRRRPTLPLPRQTRDPNPAAAKLNAANVRAIRLRYGLGESKRSIARRYGVSPTCITQVVERLTWRHVK